MAKRRREWKESLKKTNEPIVKKKKINITSHETYKVINGNLVCVESTVHKKDEITTTHPSNILTNSSKMNQLTPHQLRKDLSIKNLTPTYRKPECFLDATKKVMKKAASPPEIQEQENLSNREQETHNTTESENFYSPSQSRYLRPKRNTESDEVTNMHCQKEDSCTFYNTNDKDDNYTLEEISPVNILLGMNSQTVVNDFSDSEDRSNTKKMMTRRQLFFPKTATDIENIIIQYQDNNNTITADKEKVDVVADACDTSHKLIIQDEVHSDSIPQKVCGEKPDNQIDIQADVPDGMPNATRDEPIIADACNSSHKMILHTEIHSESILREMCHKQSHNQVDFCDEMAKAAREDTNSADACHKITIQAEIHGKPIPRKVCGEESHNEIYIQADFSDGIMHTKNGEIVSADCCDSPHKIITQAQILSNPNPEKKTNGRAFNQIALYSDSDDEITVLPDDNTSVDAEIENSANIDIRTNKQTEIDSNRKKIYRKKRNVHYNKSYLDFMSDDDLNQRLIDEAFPSEASDEENYSSESEGSSSCDSREGISREKKNKRKQAKAKEIPDKTSDHNISALKKTPKASLKKENVDKRNKGQAYTNNNGEVVPAKSMKPNPCIGKKCGNDCGNISEERRQTLFTYFMNLNSHQRRKDWIAQCAIKVPVKRSRSESGKRSFTYEYFINEGEGRRRVCQKYLINTLDVTQRFILYTLDTMIGGFAKADDRGKSGGFNRTKESVLEHATQFMNSLPMMPSHYCRGESSRLYLPSQLRNLTNLHRIYMKECKNNGFKGMSYQVFRTWFKETYNVGFHVPKKDKCVICSSIKDKENEDGEDTNEEEDDQKRKEKEEIVLKHIEEKDESYNRFRYHQNLHTTDKNTICASFDMQKVLNTPHGDSMMLYYSRKLAVYNFTIYESTTRKAYCNVWTEADANRGADEISTCLFNYIKDVDSRVSIKTLLLYCDSCFGQNKNKTVLSMSRYALSKCENLSTIQINYLVPGHTYMPVDSVHATIEKKTKKTIIWAPSQWPTVMEVARQDPEPYMVTVLNGKDFIGFTEIVNSTFKKNQKIEISKLKIVTFKKENPNTMYAKKSMLPKAELIIISLLTLADHVLPNYNLYPSTLGISAAKLKDLKKLIDKKIIPTRFTSEYKNIKTNNKKKDCLDETDEEDNIEQQ